MTQHPNRGFSPAATLNEGSWDRGSSMPPYLMPVRVKVLVTTRVYKCNYLVQKFKVWKQAYMKYIFHFLCILGFNLIYHWVKLVLIWHPWSPVNLGGFCAGRHAALNISVPLWSVLQKVVILKLYFCILHKTSFNLIYNLWKSSQNERSYDLLKIMWYHSLLPRRHRTGGRVILSRHPFIWAAGVHNLLYSDKSTVPWQTISYYISLERSLQGWYNAGIFIATLWKF